jgi:hypothetical protein
VKGKTAGLPLFSSFIQTVLRHIPSGMYRSVETFGAVALIFIRLCGIENFHVSLCSKVKSCRKTNNPLFLSQMMMESMQKE